AGAAIACLRIHNALIESGVESRILTLEESNDKSIQTFLEPKDNLFHKYLNYFKKFFPRVINKLITKNNPDEYEIFTGPYSLLKLENYIKKEKPDIIHLHWVSFFINYSSFFKKLRHIPIVWTLHDMNPFTGGCHYSYECVKYESNCKGCPQLVNSILPKYSSFNLNIKNNALKNINNLSIVGVSSWVSEVSKKSTLFKKYDHYTIGNAIFTDLFKPLNAPFLKNLLTNKTIILFLCDSFHRFNKGFDLFEKAIEYLKNKDNYFIILMGHGSQSQELKNFKTMAINHTNSLEKISLIYSLADVSCVPSRYETFSQVTAESMSCGTPVVAFDATGPKDIIDHKENGFLAKSYNPKDFAEGIEWIIKNNVESKLSDRARNKIITTFSKNIIISKYIKLYDKLSNEKIHFSIPNNTQELKVNSFETNEIDFGLKNCDIFKFIGWSNIYQRGEDPFFTSCAKGSESSIIAKIPTKGIMQIEIFTPVRDQKIRILINNNFVFETKLALASWQTISFPYFNKFNVDIDLISFNFEKKHKTYNTAAIFKKIKFKSK
ncbi:MAG: glycosyltransferase, partial [Candidatus Kapaibacterium sp.]